MYAIGDLCKQFNFSRSTLLYYDGIGLLRPSARTDSNYRQYSEEDKQRLSEICAFREAGVPLAQIREILDNNELSESEALKERLSGLNQEIRVLRFKQQLIVKMLNDKGAAAQLTVFDAQAFSTLLTSCGLDEEALARLHRQFEKENPHSHQFFLEFLGFSDEEITRIRDNCASDSL